MIDDLKETIEQYKDFVECETATAKVLRNVGNEDGARDYEETAENDKRIVAWLTELQERREADRWIPVRERLPEEDADYEITLKNKQVTIDHAVDGKFMFHNGDIIAWKPKPKPYESEDK